MTLIADQLVAGVDEVGRGPLAGPVMAAAVILDPARPIEGLADSKKLSAKKRELLAAEIRNKAFCWSIARCEPQDIDRLNILQASLLAMKKAVETLSVKPGHCLIDGNKLPDLSCSAEAIVKGDLTEPAISAASIIAKVARDLEMIEMDALYPGYGFAQNKGYPTQAHRKAIQLLGVTRIHRRSFAPVQTQLKLTRS